MAGLLLEDLKKSGFTDYAAIKSKKEKEFENLDSFYNTLEAINKLHCDDSCRVYGGCSAFKCQIFECCTEKGYQGCWQCDDLDACDKFEFLKPLHADTPKQNLKIIREKGINGCPESRNKFYVWE